MTKALERAFKAAASLPEAEQDALAAAILEDLATEERWTRALAERPAELARLADEALDEDEAGKTLPLDPDEV